MENKENEKYINISSNQSLWKMAIKCFFDHMSVRQSIDHYKDFWFIWEILLVLALGLAFLSPIIEWYYRIPLVIIAGIVLFGHLKDICKLMGIGNVLFIIVYIGMIISFMFLPPLSGWQFDKWLCRIMLISLTLLIILRPMNAVYGLMGTNASIRVFFSNFIIISLIFSSIYYFGFFKDAGITYDVNQPHIDFQRYAVANKADSPSVFMSTKKDTVYVEHKLDNRSYTETIIETHVIRDTLPAIHYQPIDFMQVWRSTIMTTLTQESADLLSSTTVHNDAVKSTNTSLDKEKSEMFEWILIFHIIISWIFFGVFISLIYNKFRYES